MASCDPDPPLTGVVLDVFEHGESDLIVTLFTRERGRLAAIAKGARRSRRRFVNKLEPFTSLRLHLTPSRQSSLYRLDEAEIISSRPELRFNYHRFTGASLICELILQWTREADPAPELHKLITWSLDRVHSGDVPWTVTVFTLRLLDLGGHRPVLDSCVICGKERKGAHRLSYSHHGLVCRGCDHGGLSGKSLSAGMIRAMKELLAADLARVERIGLSRTDRKCILTTLLQYSAWLLQKETRSWKLFAGMI